MSHPKAIRGALWKGEQLQRAAKMGFSVPQSLISSDPDAVRDFVQTLQQGTVFKSLSTPVLPTENESGDNTGELIPTTLITSSHDELISSVSLSPCFFQEYIAKRYELRVTVIGDQVFAAKLHSQDDERTRIDSRDMSADILYEYEKLPAKVEAMCRDLVRSYDLTYGALDLIVNLNGDYVFLENNPAGQYHYIEELVPEFNLSDIVANYLSGEADKT